MATSLGWVITWPGLQTVIGSPLTIGSLSFNVRLSALQLVIATLAQWAWAIGLALGWVSILSSPMACQSSVVFNNTISLGHYCPSAGLTAHWVMPVQLSTICLSGQLGHNNRPITIIRSVLARLVTIIAVIIRHAWVRQSAHWFWLSHRCPSSVWPGCWLIARCLPQ